MKSNPIPSTLFISNREKLAELMAPGSVALAGSSEMMIRNGDQFFPTGSIPDFFYLTGINQRKCVILAPDHPDPDLRENPVYQETNFEIQGMDGTRPYPEEAAILSGITQVNWLDELERFIEFLFTNAPLSMPQEKYPAKAS